MLQRVDHSPAAMAAVSVAVAASAMAALTAREERTHTIELVGLVQLALRVPSN